LGDETGSAYKHEEVMRDQILQAVQSAHELRTALGSHWIEDLDAAVQVFISQMDRIVVMLESKDPPDDTAGTGEYIRKLQDLGRQLTASAFEHKDSVRCMDDLEHEILPLLEGLLRDSRQALP
jgi:hypothetical protein